MIGILDSGLGGLSLWNELPETANVLYLADTAHLPYGTKSKQELFLLANEMLDHLTDLGATTLVIACHTLSTTIAPLLKRPVITVASAVTPVPYKKIGLIGTEATVRSHYYQKRFPITSAVACPKLVASIEQGDLDLSELEYLSKDIEALLLGCTHFPLIQEHLPPIPLIDPSRALAESLPKTTGSSTFYTTGDPLQFHQRATIFSKRKKIPFPFPLKSLYSSSLS